MSIFPKNVDLAVLNSDYRTRLEQVTGVFLTEVGESFLNAEFDVIEVILQPFGIMHGGFSCVVAESLGSIAGHLVLQNPLKTVVGQSVNVFHLRPATLGTRILAVATPTHLGRRSQLWEIQLSEKISGKPIARAHLTLAVIDK